LALVFIVSAYGKFRSRAAFSAFVQGLRDMRVVPSAVVVAVAWAVVVAETTIPFLLAVPATAIAGLLSAMVVLAAFTGAVLVVLTRGTRASCPCFGSSLVQFGRRHIVRNGILLAVGATAIVSSADGGGRVEMAGTAVAVAAATTLAIVIVSFDELTDLLTGFPERSHR
jgi:hypothetical protein